MRKLGWILVAVVLTLASSVSAQVDTAWIKLHNPGYNDIFPEGLASSTNGRLYVVGLSYLGEPRGIDFTIVCYSADGAVLWERLFDDSYIDIPSAIATDHNGNLYITGRSYYDIQTVVYDSNGTLVWSNRHPDSAGMLGEGKLITTDSDGNVYVAAGVGFETCTLLKYDNQGILQWKTGYRGWLDASATAVGLQLDSNGDVIVACFTRSFGTSEDYVVLKYHEVQSDSVQLMWERKYSSLGRRWDQPSAMCLDLEDNVYVTGFVSQVQPYSGCATVKLRPDGSIAWAKVFSDGGSCQGLDIECGPDSSIIVSGTSWGPSGEERVLLLRYASDGTQLWTSTYGRAGVDFLGLNVAVAPDGELFVACKSDSSDISESAILCYAPQGTLRWHSREGVIPFNARLFNQPMFVIAPRTGEIYFTALAAADPLGSSLIRTKKLVIQQPLSLDFIPSSCPNIISTGVTDLHYRGIRPGPAAANRPTLPVAILGTKAFDVSRVDPSTIEIAGLYPLSHRLMDVSRPMAVRESECECTTAGSDGYMDLVLYFDREQFVAALGPVNDGELRTLELTGKTKTGVPLSGSDCLTIKVGPIRVSPLASAGEKSEAGFAAYPNPFNAATVMSFYLATESDVRLDVYDVLGRRVATLVDDMMPAGEHQASWVAAGVASGVYFARLSTSAGMMTRKLVLVR